MLDETHGAPHGWYGRWSASSDCRLRFSEHRSYPANDVSNPSLWRSSYKSDAGQLGDTWKNVLLVSAASSRLEVLNFVVAVWQVRELACKFVDSFGGSETRPC